MKKLYAIIMSLCLLAGAFPVSALAADIDYEAVTQDGSVSTTLTYTEEYTPMGNEFVVNIPSSISWDNSTEADFNITLGTQFPLYDGFAVDVYVSPDCFTKDGAVEYVKLNSSTGGEHYVGFSLIADDYSFFTAANNLVARFTSSGASPNGHVILSNTISSLDPMGDGIYKGVITFNIVSEYY